jgi:uncharacterized membrane protein
VSQCETAHDATFSEGRDMYLVLKVVHILAVVLFLGNIGLAMLCKLDADRTHNPVIIAHVLRGVVLGDRWITVPSAIVLAVSGVTMAIIAQLPLLHVSWIWQSLLLFLLSGALYVFPIGPDQRRLQALAQAACSEPASMDWVAYASLSRRWLRFGALAILAPAVALVLMVLKP